MKVKMLLLVSAVVLVLLVGPDAANHANHGLDNNLSFVFMDIDKYNKSLAQDFFVEDVSHLAEGKNKCEDKFFCKVHDILKSHFDRKTEEDSVERNLKMYLRHRSVNCTELMKNMTDTGVKKPIPDLLGYLKGCIQTRNLHTHNH